MKIAMFVVAAAVAMLSSATAQTVPCSCTSRVNVGGFPLSISMNSSNTGQAFCQRGESCYPWSAEVASWCAGNDGRPCAYDHAALANCSGYDCAADCASAGTGGGECGGSSDGIRDYGTPRRLPLAGLPQGNQGRAAPGKWKGGVFGPATSLVYGVPHTIGTILAFNPASAAISLIPIDGLGPVLGNDRPRWSAGVLDPGSGKIFFVPNSAPRGAVFDPATNVTDVAAFASERASRRLANTVKWNDGVYHTRSGKIWCIPVMESQVQAVMSVDPATNATVDHEVRQLRHHGCPFLACYTTHMRCVRCHTRCPS